VGDPGHPVVFFVEECLQGTVGHAGDAIGEWRSGREMTGWDAR
jgi:hypothetical protein